jgi:hypothetical protein
MLILLSCMSLVPLSIYASAGAIMDGLISCIVGQCAHSQALLRPFSWPRVQLCSATMNMGDSTWQCDANVSSVPFFSGM